MNSQLKNRHSGAGGRGIGFLPSAPGRFFVSLVLLLACLAAPAAAAAEELGRLFLTPQQRRDLDARRASNRVEEEMPQIKEGPLTVEGRVQRSSGKSATWINGAPQYENDSNAGGDPARVTVVPNKGEPSVRLKVGQTYERASGEVRDNLNGGEITVGKSSPKVEPPAKRGSAAKSPAPSR